MILDRRPAGIALGLLVCMASGCGGQESFEGAKTAMAPPASAPGQTVTSDAYDAVERTGGAAPTALASARDRAAPGAVSATAVPPAQTRKIIYTGRVELVTENFPVAEKNLLALVQAQGGYIANADVGGVTGSQRRGSWTVRVPVDRYQPFIDGASKLGEQQTVHSDSQDVGMEYYDLEARITAKLQEEKRLLKHLDESTGKLEDILGVERELSRVRSEVEQMQGRIRYLANMTSLSTVTVTLVEIQKFVPQAAPGFASRVRRSFEGSVANLTDFLEGIAILAVVVSPWLVFILPMLTIAVLLARASRRRARV